MWNKMIRNMEWLLIVALLVGAVIAVGCGEDPGTNYENHEITASFNQIYINLGETAFFSSRTSDGTQPSVALTIWPTSPNNKPALVPFTPSGAAIPDPPGYVSITPDVAGDYTICAYGSPGVIKCATVTARDPNPTADAGPDQTVNVNQTVTLTGNQDPERNSGVATHWSVTSAPGSVILEPNDGKSTSFTPTIAGVYVVHLDVYGRSGTTLSPGPLAYDTVTITVVDPGNNPVANAGPDQNATVNNIVTLNGSMSYHPYNLQLAYLWSLASVPSGSNATLTNASSLTPVFTPDLAGDYVISLTVGDGLFSSVPDTVIITTSAITPANTAPVANAGPDQNATVGNMVTLSGTMSSDANGNSLTYSWTLTPTSGSSATLTNANTVSPTFTPNVIGDYVASLIVNDGMVNSTADTVIISATAPVGGGTPAYVTDLKNLLTDNSFLVTHITASSGLLEVLEFGPYGPGGSMTFTYINPYFSSQSPHVRRTGSWMVLDGGGFAQASESLLFASRVLNTGSPVDATSSLTMTGYSSYSGITDSSVESWVKVAPLTVNDLAGRTFTSYPYSYSFTSDGSGSYGNAYSAPLPFTWLIDSVGRKAVLTFANGSTHQLFMTVRGLSGSVDREFGILALDSNGAVNSSSLMNWSW